MPTRKAYITSTAAYRVLSFIQDAQLHLFPSIHNFPFCCHRVWNLQPSYALVRDSSLDTIFTIPASNGQLQ